MKGVLALILVVLMTVTFVGCSDSSTDASKGQEKITANCPHFKEVDGQYYLDVDDKIAKVKLSDYKSGGCVLFSDDIVFFSIDEFVNRVIDCDFEDMELAAMAREVYFKRGQYGFKICDFNKIYVPATPEDYSVDYLHWYGETYTFILESNGNPRVTIDFETKESFKENLEKTQSSIFKSNYVMIERIENNEKENCTEIYYYHINKDDKYSYQKIKRYKLEENLPTYENDSVKTDIYIDEYHGVKSSTDSVASGEIPYRVEIHAQNEYVQYSISIDNYKRKEIDKDWILQFGLKPIK